MKNENKKRHTMEKKRWIHIYSVVLIAALILVCATTMWFRSTRQSSEKTVNDMVRFYLTEIAERNSGAILFELDKRVSQIQRVTDVLSQEDLRDEQCIRDFVETVQQISGLDLFALVDEQGMVYTEDSTFLGTTQSYDNHRVTYYQPRRLRDSHGVLLYRADHRKLSFHYGAQWYG